MYEDYNGIDDDYAAINRELNIGQMKAAPAAPAPEEDKGSPVLPLKVASPPTKKKASSGRSSSKKPSRAEAYEGGEGPLAYATVSLILGIVGFIFCIPAIGTALSILGLVYGIIALAKHVFPKAKAIAGVILSALGIAASGAIIGLLIYNDVFYTIYDLATGGYTDIYDALESLSDYDYEDYADYSDYLDDIDPDSIPEGLVPGIPGSSSGSSPLPGGDGSDVDGSDDGLSTFITDDMTEYFVGESLDDDGLDIIYASSGILPAESAPFPPASGSKIIYIELACENYADTERIISYAAFTCYADGKAIQPYTGATDLLQANLPLDGITTGRIYFEVPEASSYIAIEYSYSYDTAPGERSMLIYEGEKTSGFTFSSDDYEDDSYEDTSDDYEDDSDDGDYV